MKKSILALLFSLVFISINGQSYLNKIKREKECFVLGPFGVYRELPDGNFGFGGLVLSSDKKHIKDVDYMVISKEWFNRNVSVTNDCTLMYGTAKRMEMVKEMNYIDRYNSVRDFVNKFPEVFTIYQGYYIPIALAYCAKYSDCINSKLK